MPLLYRQSNGSQASASDTNLKYITLDANQDSNKIFGSKQSNYPSLEEFFDDL
jgi:hypothetical protein